MGTNGKNSCQVLTTSEAKNRIEIEGDLAWIYLTQGQRARVAVKDLPLVRGQRWYAALMRGQFRAVSKTGPRGQTMVYMHRVISGCKPGEEVDHEDGDPLNNFYTNLRPCTPYQNSCNRKLNANNKTGFKGVHVRYGKWYAVIQVKKKTVFSKVFATAVEAAKAYNVAAVRFFGQFARLNPIPAAP